MLFLNKVDLLADKLARGIQLQDYLPDYSGRNTPAEALKHMRRYLLDQFKDVRTGCAHRRHGVQSELTSSFASASPQPSREVCEPLAPAATTAEH